jgi:predicted phosphodiesterase
MKHEELIKHYLLNDSHVKALVPNKTQIAEYIILKENLDDTVEGMRKLVRKSLETVDVEMIKECVNIGQKLQKSTDKHRIERKTQRENYRLHNAIEEYSKELLKVFSGNNLQIQTSAHESNGGVVGVAHISDAHFNELVNLPTNTYDFTVASKRFQKYVNKSIGLLNGAGVTDLVIALTGDLMNSDRRLDELLALATNRSNATFLAVQILTNVIVEFNKHFNITVVSVSGNESRVNKDLGWVSQVATDTYDTTISNILYCTLKDKKGITIIPESPLEQVIDINGKNILLMHGHQFKGNLHTGIANKIRQYADKGVIINFVLFGHIHECLIADLYARSSSPVGANAYSENALGLTSRASQNLHLIGEHDIDSIKIDLQNVDNYKGYPIQKELEAYNAKSADKANPGTAIFKVVI